MQSSQKEKNAKDRSREKLQNRKTLDKLNKPKN